MIDTAPVHAAVLNTFGQDVTYTPLGGASYTVTGSLMGGDGVQNAVPGSHYRFWAPDSEFTARPQKGDTVAISTQTFRVADVLPGGLGSTVLLLHYVRP